MDELPLHVIFDIFSRIPVKTLLKLRCVSKSWLTIIDDPFLCYMHIYCRSVDLQTPLLIPTFTKLPHETSIHEARDNGEDIIISAGKTPTANLHVNGFCTYGSCNGLLYFAEYQCDEKIVVSNPLRNQFRVLPSIYSPPDDETLALMNIQQYSWLGSKHPEESPVNAYGLGFDSSTNTFKMVCVLQNTGECMGTLVHNLGTNSWREISSTPQYPISGKPVFAHGWLHWFLSPLRWYYGDLPVDNKLVAFDVRKEIFEIIPHPGIWSKHVEQFKLIDSTGNFKLFDMNGDLAVADISLSDKDIDIWVMNYEKKEWSQMYTIRLTERLASAYSNTCIYAIACVYNDSDIGIWKEGEIFLKSYKVTGYTVQRRMT